MKKNYVMLAFATLMMASCANNDLLEDVVNEEAPKAIGFETFSNKISRQVADATALNSYHDAFGVWAYKTVDENETLVMENYKVGYTPTTVDGNTTYSWEYKNVDNQSLKYWDKQATKYSFYAYAPYAASSVVSISDGKISIADGEYAANENLQSNIVESVETGFTTSLNSNKFSGTGAGATNASTDWMIADDETVATANFGDEVEEKFKHTMSKLIVILKSDDVAAGTKVEVTSVSVNNVHGKGSFDGTEWTATDDAKSITGIVGELKTTSGYYSMEYLLIPSKEGDAAPTFSIEYTVNDDIYTVTNATITNIAKFEANTCYTLTATIGLEPIVFTAIASEFEDPDDDPSVTIQ